MDRFALALLILGLSAPAFAQDAGTSSTADGGVSPGCGNITVEGECQGSVVVYCDETNDEVVRLDCPVDYDPASDCAQISVDFGVYCALSVGEACYAEDDQGNLDPYFCQGTNPGCVEGADTIVCLENVGPCAVDQIGDCTGERLLFDCFETQPYVIDCAAIQGHCQGSACRDLPADSPCDDETYVCANGLECVLEQGADAGGFVCRPISTADAGTNPDAGSVDVQTNLPNPDEDKGCSCSVHRAQAAPVGMFFVLVWFLRRRDRR